MPQRETEGGEKKTFTYVLFWQMGCSLGKKKDIWQTDNNKI